MSIDPRLGEGLLGFIGLNFNDAFGYAWARQGVPKPQNRVQKIEQRCKVFTKINNLSGFGAQDLFFPIFLFEFPVTLACY